MLRTVLVGSEEYLLEHQGYLTIIPRVRMGYESIAHEGERNNCFSEIQLVGQKIIKTKHLFASFTAKTLQIWGRFSLLAGYNI